MARKSAKRSKKNAKSVVNDRDKITRLIDSRAAKKKTNDSIKESLVNTPELEKQFGALLQKFEIPLIESTSKLNKETSIVQKQIDSRTERQGLGSGQDVEEEEINDSEKPVSKKKLRKLAKPTLSQLKSSTTYPQVIEWYDCDARYPYLLASIKSSKNVVPIPSHWQVRREYLSGRSLLEKRPFELPDIIKQTDIEVLRKTLPDGQNDKDEQSLKEISRARIQPKLGSLDIDYKKLHDVFFKLGTNWKPDVLLPFGDQYYENRNLYDEAQWKKTIKETRPGKISSELRQIMNLPEGQLPPWCAKMNSLGMPPGYPNLRIAGLNWEIENLKGDCYGELRAPDTTKDVPLFGSIIAINDETVVTETEHQGHDERKSPSPATKIIPPNTMIDTPKESHHKKSPVETITTVSIERRRSSSETDDGTSKTLYTVLKEQSTDVGSHHTGSKSAYVIPSMTQQKSDNEEVSTNSNTKEGDQTQIETFKF